MGCGAVSPDWGTRQAAKFLEQAPGSGEWPQTTTPGPAFCLQMPDQNLAFYTSMWPKPHGNGFDSF